MERKLSREPRDAIAAVATAPGRGGIGVVRVSGPDLLGLAEKISNSRPQPRVATLASFRDASGAILDQGILLYFPAPHSFTGEDVLELQGHGGPIVLQLLLTRCLELGARLAEPGEFTRRAFLNDKLDLAQAEAVADLIEAATEQAARAALRSLSGEFSEAVHGLVERLIELRMWVESSLDFPDEEIEVVADTAPRLLQLQVDLERLRSRAKQGSLLRNGLHVVLAGPPNVGKSSLLNRLAGEDRAIVAAIAGTTRDTVRETIQIEGIPLHIIDTAGLRETEDALEKLGIERTWREIARADVVLQLLDASAGTTVADNVVAEQLPTGVPRVVVHNKCDLVGQLAERCEQDGVVHLKLSAKTGEGISLLHDELLAIAGWAGHGEDTILARARHLEALAATGAHLAQAVMEMPRLELCAEELRLAQLSLAAITGEFSADDLLGEIFSRFCIGK